MATQAEWYPRVSRFAARNEICSRPAAWTSIVQLACGSLLLLATGCSTLSRAPTADPAAYAALGCNELNNEITAVSTDISRTAITRGRVTQTNIPTWVPGGQRVATAVVDRQTTRIEGLREQERAMAAARAGACRR
jgi:hypothetical protein